MKISLYSGQRMSDEIIGGFYEITYGTHHGKQPVLG